MPSSIVKRERLVKPQHLALIGVLFALSFFFLLPKQEDFTISAANPLAPADTSIGELDLAYLKARGASGKESVEETSQAIVALVRTGQVDEAKKLLERQPSATIGAKERYSLDLEIASVEYFAAQTASEQSVKQLQLLNRIELLLHKPEIRTQAHLERAANLSAQLGQSETAAALFLLLAEQDSTNAVKWYTQCGEQLAALQKHELAADCFSQAIPLATSSDEKFELTLMQLAQISVRANSLEQDALVDKLFAFNPSTAEQIEKLANSLLANQRPDRAYPLYAQLAQIDTPNQVAWLMEAAKWAQASNNAAAAAGFIDQAASLSDAADKVALLEKAEALLVASGQIEEAFARLANRIESDPQNAEQLRTGIVLARQLGKEKQAAIWNKQLLMVNPTNLDAVNTQIDLSLASRDLPAAAKWSRHAIGLAPNSIDAHRRYAQIAEWNGDPVAAQHEWEWLVERRPAVESLTQLVRIAQLNRDSAVAADALLKLVVFAPNNDEKIRQLIKLYELEGTPLRAASVLQGLQQTNGTRAFTQRELAKLYQRHVMYDKALVAWDKYASEFGRSTEETLNRMELSWRLNKPDQAAKTAEFLIDQSHVSEASQYQVQLISEIAWRFRMPKLAQLVKPHIEQMEDEYQSLVLGKRLVQSLEDEGKEQEAISEAMKLWQSTRSTDVAFTAMNLAIRTGSSANAKPLLAQDSNTAPLRKKADYWLLASSMHRQNGEVDLAQAALEQALKLDPKNTSALSALLWAYIDAQDIDSIANFIEQHQPIAETEPQLWSAFAIAHLQLGLPELSLTWFDRQLDRIEADYNMLLTFADALEYAGRAEPARKVRLYAIKRLRPVLADGSTKDKDNLIRQYASLLNRYGSAEDKERLSAALLKDTTHSASNQFWREDVAISWLMATQRHEHARLVMAKLHEQRLQAPAWQALALALAANDRTQIRQVLNGTGKVSIGNHILALRQIGQDGKAYRAAKQATTQAPTIGDRNIARNQYAAIRSERPSFSSATYKQTSISGLGIRESGISVRHTFDSMNLGWGVDFVNRGYTSNAFNLLNREANQDVALTLYHGDRQFGGEITAGIVSDDINWRSYAIAKHRFQSLNGRRTLNTELAYNETSTDSALLRLTAKQHRLSLAYEQALGFREYIKLQADVKDINTRVEQKRIARGLAGRMEFGIRGAFGSNVWSTSVAASRSQNELAASLPAELALFTNSSIDSVISDSTTALSLGASLSRGGVASGYPQASSPRYYLNANINHTWPDATFGAQFDGGAGVRVLGGDELSIGFSHDTQPLNSLGSSNDSSSLGVNYRYHF